MPLLAPPLYMQKSCKFSVLFFSEDFCHVLKNYAKSLNRHYSLERKRIWKEMGNFLSNLFESAWLKRLGKRFWGPCYSLATLCKTQINDTCSCHNDNGIHGFIYHHISCKFCMGKVAAGFSVQLFCCIFYLGTN